ncbi:MAG TPA: sensor histidine kinase [Candidatus Nitrosotenuis sp.]|nr:sensor histidine kinase [Candidatus Nitrosotenuis sp.]
MEDMSLHILDIVENALRAGAKHVVVRLTEDKGADRLVLEVTDDGAGMNEEIKKKSLDPFFTTKRDKKIGLGLPFLAQAAEEAGGRLEIRSAPGQGTTVMATFGLSHIDRKPLGNIQETMRCLTATHPEVSFRFECAKTE